MDALELVRRRARSRRAATVGSDRPAAWELVRRLAEEEGFDLYGLQPDDALLNGAEAVLDRGIEAIFYNGDVDTADAAALIAHELGHLDLHEGVAACHNEEIDPSSPDEPTPAGIHRIETYGARERQELQANVYARELLLPRDETRRLFDRRTVGGEIVARGLRGRHRPAPIHRPPRELQTVRRGDAHRWPGIPSIRGPARTAP